MAVVGEPVVASKGDEATKGGPKRVEDLGGSVGPDIDRLESLPFWLEVEGNSVGSTLQCGASDEQNQEDNVREKSSEVYDLP